MSRRFARIGHRALSVGVLQGVLVEEMAWRSVGDIARDVLKACGSAGET
jgi:hypothetical protein